MQRKHLWAIALFFWVIGDCATTLIGLNMGFVEKNPVAYNIIQQYGKYAIVWLKLTSLVPIYIIYNVAFDWYKKYIIYYVAFAGVAFTAWNTYLIMTV